MGLAARFFAHLQDAEFYRAVHEQAVALLPNGAGRTWLDIGCGPGLVARLAADRGYRAVGRDINPDMVRMAQRIARRHGSSAAFEAGDIAQPRDGQADVVSAASLLFVLNDRAKALRHMRAHLKPGGTLLVIETTESMRIGDAWRWLRHAGYTKRVWMLLVWAWVRNGMAVSQDELKMEGWDVERKPLMGGLVAAWIFSAARAA